MVFCAMQKYIWANLEKLVILLTDTVTEYPNATYKHKNILFG